MTEKLNKLEQIASNCGFAILHPEPFFTEYVASPKALEAFAKAMLEASPTANSEPYAWCYEKLQKDSTYKTVLEWNKPSDLSVERGQCLDVFPLYTHPADEQTTWKYYYKVDGCPTNNAHDGNCICWHKEGSGNFPDEKHDDKHTLLKWLKSSPADEQLKKDAERYRWLRDNNATVIKIENERRGFRSTAPDAIRERWFEFSGWSVSTLSIHDEFKTMDEAIDKARGES